MIYLLLALLLQRVNNSARRDDFYKRLINGCLARELCPALGRNDAYTTIGFGVFAVRQ